jgi:hypothetical protein
LHDIKDRDQPVAERSFDGSSVPIATHRTVGAQHEPVPAEMFHRFLHARQGRMAKDNFLRIGDIVEISQRSSDRYELDDGESEMHASPGKRPWRIDPEAMPSNPE